MLPTENDLTAANYSSYAPIQIQCPKRDQWVRSAGGLSDEETLWVEGRKHKVLEGLTSYLERLNLSDFDLETYLARLQQNEANVPALGMAISGGAWSSALTGTGALRAIDDRFSPAVEQRIGGLLQSLTYLAGLSGGSWPVMGLATYNFPTIDAMVHAWHVDISRTTATTDTEHAATIQTMIEQIAPKHDAGYSLSYMDLLGRMFAYEFVEGPNGGMATTVSGIAELSKFREHNMPLPLWQAPQLVANDTSFYGIRVPADNAAIYEWTPFEVGSWTGPEEFFPTKYLGTKMSDGLPVDNCVVGYDKASFMLGMAADAWNYWLLEAYSNNTLGSFAKRNTEPPTNSITKRAGPPLSFLDGIASLFQQAYGLTRNASLYVNIPNPFTTSTSTANSTTTPTNLTLVDESEILQAIPLWGLAQPARGIDFIIAWDSDGDAAPYSWNNGTSLYGTYIYAKNHGVPFPIVPEPATFINRNYSIRPTFFGCDANLTTTNDTQAPIILYLGNAPYSAYTNYSAFQSAFSDENIAVIMTNGFNQLSQGNGTLDAEWPECLGCAAIDRSLAKVGMQRSEQCQRCLERYCWDGVSDDNDSGIVDPALILDPSFSFEEWNRTGPQGGDFWAEV
ncbi:hypothetical protein M409DRAFT_36163 [Zasmidium cellare ATCC 36951]|uniref:Lysophospholipase n=1 Tax=Zasmidium cellare ATCC 36951 TaxID=1080233 RepID=A0A6A6CPJ3_ZASCE|nr:uncharacterized protein M409DRAFT_36163 [Zasmidium cellare ATCC 36951]KAF2169207.1 hypothetical protein M409DRAFT_36163 [Zasmidium cellare ATCC 36951]